MERGPASGWDLPFGEAGEEHLRLAWWQGRRNREAGESLRKERQRVEAIEERIRAGESISESDEIAYAYSVFGTAAKSCLR